MKSGLIANKYEAQEDHETSSPDGEPNSTCSTGLEGTDTSSDQANTREGESSYGTLKCDGLTVSNLALHRERFRQSEPFQQPNQQPPQPRLELEAAGIPEMKTLSASNPELSARRIAYQQRKESRKEARRQGAIDNTGFLSNVPEVDDDVPFRFNFVVIGGMAHHVVQVTCSSASASSTSSKFPVNLGQQVRSPRESPKRGQAFRCLCFVTAPVTGRVNLDRQKLAKLVFQPVAFGQSIPKSTSRLDALSTAMVFVLSINHPSGDRLSLEEQLANLANVLEQNRTETKAKLRPVRAVILCSFHNPNVGHADESWAAQLADFEQVHGDMWKFGPIYTEDGDAFHAAFAEMASLRINRVNLSDVHADSLQLAEKPDEDEVEATGEDVEDERTLLEQQLFARSARSGGELERSNSVSSLGSEGWQRPPIFEAECDGSECSEAALEQHVQIFGLDRKTSNPELLGAGGNQDLPESTPLTSTETSSKCVVS
mmetsp:Transcript_124014/g.246953  ORF Transcript_124014/g.246953 Transcript_124014/m.246953 type:complete len:486 (-) Transcript_124014:171-1628(-)|eukprot:CAMPEP_0172672954 /NCGR_PEP_ID=MMETSP1074-20121228/11856_1 /TAXON_ID=2916 /ORGANISM="Ceratium fusus, Strain PA161109" /LENGTH=485 /DNA_ID=CAMNT_0013490207 /DNA_START=103 /DNA_END=1560 /DNA_ORIENTATION=+